MTASNLHAVKAVGLADVLIGGSFRPAGIGAITNLTGPGWTAARTGVGVVLVTFNENFSVLKGLVCSAREASGTETIVQGGDFTAGTATTGPTLEIETYQAGAAVDLAADPDNVVSFMAWVQNTSDDSR